MPSPSLITGPSPARPAPGRLAARAALALSLWMAAAPTSAGAEEDGVEGAAATTGYETRREDGTGTPAGEKRRGQGRRKTGKGAGDFDPKVFEARGRELQGEYYEIATMARTPTWSGGPTGLPAEAGAAPEEPRHRHWILWGGVAGAAACVAGLTGWLLLSQPGNAEPVSLHLDDRP